MAYSTGEVVPTPGQNKPFKVVFTVADEIVAEWPVESEAAGKKQIAEVLHGLRKVAESEGYVLFG